MVTGCEMRVAHRFGMSEAAGKSPDAGEWLDQHGDYLFRYAMLRLRDPAAAEDVVLDTLLAALQASARFEGQGHGTNLARRHFEAQGAGSFTPGQP